MGPHGEAVCWVSLHAVQCEERVDMFLGYSFSIKNIWWKEKNILPLQSQSPIWLSW